LHEYDALRRQIEQRTGHGYLLFSAAALAFFNVTAIDTLGLRFWIVFAISGTTILLASWFIIRDIGLASRRLRELEEDINDRAEEDLLVWETVWGIFPQSPRAFFSAPKLTKSTRRVSGKD
jgi:hypothetical protein